MPLRGNSPPIDGPLTRGESTALLLDWLGQHRACAVRAALCGTRKWSTTKI
jgi:hypothetical protein